ncbi:MAG: sulfate ABC transporter substrate-binding protein [Nocardioides sp.]
MSIKWKTAVTASVAGLLALTACGGGSGASESKGTTLNVVGYSVLEQANEGVFRGFQSTAAGKDVEFKTSYGASGDQSRAVEAGQKADEVHFSLEPDVTRLVDAGIVDKSWKDNATKGIRTSSVVVLVVRKGNPKNIHGWDDLTKPGVGIVTPNPASSGSAKWNLLAAYGHVLANGGTDAQAQSYIKDFFKNTVALPDSGRDATTAFEGGNGDVLLSYENEAILARQSGADFDYVVPDQTLLIQNPCATTKGAPNAAQDLLDYQKSAAGQKAYAETGYRPVTDIGAVTVKGANDPSNPFPAPKTLQTIDKDFGGWDTANTKFFDENNGILTKLQAAAGK